MSRNFPMSHGEQRKRSTRDRQQNKKQRHDPGRTDAAHSDRIHSLGRKHESQDQGDGVGVMLAGHRGRQYPNGGADSDQTCAECT